MNDLFPMIIIMIISGLLSVMSIWVSKFSDVRYSLNDIYMVFLMVSWMIFFMGFYYQSYTYIIIGLGLIIISLICIRKQVFINKKQYINSMIPHHSMAIHMSKKFLENNPDLDIQIRHFVSNIIRTQEAEITWMKLNSLQNG